MPSASVRVRGRAPVRTFVAWLAVLLLAGGCAPAGPAADGMSVVVSLDPVVPRVGEAACEVRLVASDGSALTGAEVSVEANMNHAGMVPTFAELSPLTDRPGVYAGTLEFTMGGDWFLIVGATLDDGRQLERVVQVPGVGSR